MNSTFFSAIVPFVSRVVRLGLPSFRSSISHRKISRSCYLHKVYIVDNNDQFMEKVMNSNNPVVVNFHAEWCEPCKILSPKLHELLEPSDTIDLAIVDVEKNPELVHTFEVKAVPAVIAIRNGLVIDKFIGLVDADMIDNLIRKLATTGDNKQPTPAKQAAEVIDSKVN